MPPKLSAVLRVIFRESKRALITIVGAALVVAGLFLIIFPGPFTIPLVIAGLAILATQYAWARRALEETKKRARSAARRFRRRR